VAGVFCDAGNLFPSALFMQLLLQLLDLAHLRQGILFRLPHLLNDEARVRVPALLEVLFRTTPKP
jgi:hypothetical protein